MKHGRWCLLQLARLAWCCATIVLVLMALEERLVYPGMFFPYQQPGLAHEAVELTTADGEMLDAGFFPSPQKPAIPHAPEKLAVLFCHGNAGTIGGHWEHVVPAWQRSIGADLLLFDYRGYGNSTGTPSERGVIEDGRSAMRHLLSRGYRANEIIIVGRSLGGGVAVPLAEEFPPRALILECTFTSLPDAAANVYPWLPVHAVMRNRMPNSERIGRVRCPVLIVQGTVDRLIPTEHARRLFERANEPKRLKFLTGVGHDDPMPVAYYQEVRDFLTQVFDQDAAEANDDDP